MANLTKTQIKANLNKLWDKEELGKLNGAIDNAIDVVDSMISDVEEERDSIEPYENKDDLTDKQQERYDWLDELANDLNEFKDKLEDWLDEMGSLYDSTYNRE